MVFVRATGYSFQAEGWGWGWALNQAAGKQEQKTERARATICKATVTCLAELGYAETTINRVVDRARVSKGALQHHFPSKEDLMANTAAYLLARPLKHAELKQADQVDSNGHASIRTRLLDIWDQLTNTSAYLALLEILIASRTDKVLHKRIAAELKASIREIDEHFLPFYGELARTDREDLMLLMTANRCLMRGLLIEEQYGLSNARQRQVLERWLDLVAPELEQKAAQSLAAADL
jgi:AcrR family transcriptional regulator